MERLTEVYLLLCFLIFFLNLSHEFDNKFQEKEQSN